MVVNTREYKKDRCNLVTEQMFKSFQVRKDSSFHTKDKTDYSVLLKNTKDDRIGE